MTSSPVFFPSPFVHARPVTWIGIALSTIFFGVTMWAMTTHQDDVSLGAFLVAMGTFILASYVHHRADWLHRLAASEDALEQLMATSRTLSPEVSIIVFFGPLALPMMLKNGHTPLLSGVVAALMMAILAPIVGWHLGREWANYRLRVLALRGTKNASA